MTISIVAALASNHVIGVNNHLPWHLSADLQHFKALTLGKTVVMGRKTHESIGKALPGRRNLILSHNPHYHATDCETVTSLDTLLQSTEEIMLIGGATLYAALLPYTQTMYLTFVDVTLPGDAFFPVWCPHEWRTTAQEAHDADAKNAYAYTFVTLKRMVEAHACSH